MQPRKLSSLVLVLLFAFFCTIAAAGQQAQSPESAPKRPRFQPPTPKNLKVLPPFISPKELMETMKKFAMGLGVRCNYCHVGEEGKPLDTYDFASDEKPAKQNARLMIEMVRHINAETLPRLKMDDQPEAVTCYTCHRGKVHPESEVPMPPRPPAPKPGL